MPISNSIFDSFAGFVWQTKREGSLDFFNLTMSRYLGTITDEIRRNWLACLHDDDLARMTTAMRELISAEKPVDERLRIRRHDGVYRWFQCNAYGLKNDSSEVSHALGTCWDIDRSVTVETALRQREGQLTALVDCIPGFVWHLGSNGELDYLNSKVCDYTGKSRKELRDPGWRQVVHPEDIDSFVAKWEAAMKTGTSMVIECRFRRVDGAYRWFRSTGEPVRDTGGTITNWCGVDIDIDDQKRLDETLQGARAQLARTAQLAIAGELSASMANAINQPLAAVVANGFACRRWLSRTPADLERATRTVDIIISNAIAAAEVVNRIHKLVAHSTPTNMPLNINGLIDAVLQLQNVEFQRHGIRVSTTLDDNLPAIDADAMLIQQVLLNLIQNSIDAMTLSSAAVKALFISTRRESDAVVVEVADNGIGFLKNAPPFAAFYSTKRDGLGLGLAIARSIIESYGGKLLAKPNDPTGAIVEFRLPTSHER